MSTINPSRQQRAKLRCCASCEWIYTNDDAVSDVNGRGTRSGCPKCGFASYGARFVHGAKAYRFAITQGPWERRRVARFRYELREEILNTCSAAKEYHRRQMVRGHSFSIND